MMRIGLFLLTNPRGTGCSWCIILSPFGVGSYHGAGGLNLGNSTGYLFLFGMVGSMISIHVKMDAKKQLVARVN